MGPDSFDAVFRHYGFWGLIAIALLLIVWALLRYLRDTRFTDTLQGGVEVAFSTLQKEFKRVSEKAEKAETKADDLQDRVTKLTGEYVAAVNAFNTLQSQQNADREKIEELAGLVLKAKQVDRQLREAGLLDQPIIDFPPTNVLKFDDDKG